MAVKLGSLIIDVKADTQNLVKGMDKAQSSVKSAVKSMKVLIAGLAIGTAFKSAIKAGYNYNKVMEEQQQSITALIAATSLHEDAMGNAITNTELYTRANAEAVLVLKDLEEINKSTPHTLGQTAQIYKTMLPSMKSLGVSTTELVEMTQKLSIAAGAGGVQFNSLLAGVDGLASGTVLANSDLGRFLNTIGLSNAKLKETTNIVELFNDKLGSFEAPDTMQVAISNLDNAWGKFMGSLTSDSFGVGKDSINFLANTINKLEENLESISVASSAVWSQMIDGVKHAGQTIKFSFSGYIDGVAKGFNIMLSNVQAEISEFVYAMDSIPFINKSMKKLSLEIMTASNLSRERANQNHKALELEYQALMKTGNAFLMTYSDRIDIFTKEINTAKISAKTHSTIAKEIELSVEATKKLEVESKNVAKEIESIRSKFDNLRNSYDEVGSRSRELVENQEFLNIALEKSIITQEEFNEVTKNMTDSYREFINSATNGTDDLSDKIDELSDKISNQLERAMTDTFRTWMDGAIEFGDLMESILKDIAAEIMRVMVINDIANATTNAITGGFTSMFGGGSTTAFAKGGIVNSPTTFPMSSGTGLMGEAGPEAIMPLSRINGDLGVKVSTSPVNINVVNNTNNNVDVQQNGDNIDILINKIESQIASNMTRGTSPLGGALNTMKFQGRL